MFSISLKLSIKFQPLKGIEIMEHCTIIEPRCEKTGLRGFRPGPTQTGLYSHRRWLGLEISDLDSSGIV